MGERKLKNRRRRASKGRAVRVSNLVYDTLDQRRGKRSWDLFFRRVFGLPDRTGRGQPLIEGMLEVHSGMMLLKLPSATWTEAEDAAYKLADKIAAKKRVAMMPPLRMREVR